MTVTQGYVLIGAVLLNVSVSVDSAPVRWVTAFAALGNMAIALWSFRDERN